MILVTSKPLDLADAYARMQRRSAGAIVVFSGNVRDQSEGRPVARLYYEVYGGMVEKVLAAIREEAIRRWGLAEMAILQRVGWIPVGEPAVLVLASHGHRAEAFEAARYGIDELKKRAPIWKKEVYTDDSESWVACHHSAEKSPEESSDGM